MKRMQEKNREHNKKVEVLDDVDDVDYYDFSSI